MAIIQPPKQYFCSRCKLEYLPTDIIDGDMKSMYFDYNLMWTKNAETTPIDKNKTGMVNLCNPCTDGLILWFQDNDIED